MPKITEKRDSTPHSFSCCCRMAVANQNTPVPWHLGNTKKKKSFHLSFPLPTMLAGTTSA